MPLRRQRCGALESILYRLLEILINFLAKKSQDLTLIINISSFIINISNCSHIIQNFLHLNISICYYIYFLSCDTKIAIFLFWLSSCASKSPRKILHGKIHLLFQFLWCFRYKMKYFSAFCCEVENEKLYVMNRNEIEASWALILKVSFCGLSSMDTLRYTLCHGCPQGGGGSRLFTLEKT